MSNFKDYDNYNNTSCQSDTVSIGTWIVILIGLAIPILNILVMIGLAFGSDNETIKNYGKAMLILVGISITLALLFGGCSRI